MVSDELAFQIVRLCGRKPCQALLFQCLTRFSELQDFTAFSVLLFVKGVASFKNKTCQTYKQNGEK